MNPKCQNRVINDARNDGVVGFSKKKLLGLSSYDTIGDKSYESPILNPVSMFRKVACTSSDLAEI